jgi:hypothetical protein
MIFLFQCCEKLWWMTTILPTVARQNLCCLWGSPLVTRSPVRTVFSQRFTASDRMHHRCGSQAFFFEIGWWILCVMGSFFKRTVAWDPLCLKKSKLVSVFLKSPSVQDLLRTARVCIISRSMLAVICPIIVNRVILQFSCCPTLKGELCRLLSTINCWLFQIIGWFLPVI